MNQQKIGAFLRELRKDKGVTQEQIAEEFRVSNRTVSRWENGNNLPDVDVLIEISDYYRVDLRELLDGERKNEKTDGKTEEIVLKAVDYTNEETERHNKHFRWLFFVGMILFVVSQVISHIAFAEDEILNAVSALTSGLACGTMIVGIIATSRFGLKLKAIKHRILKQNG